MAMIECPECGKGISDKAVSCPNCGYPLNNTSAQYKKIIPGRGFGISSMIMGIFGVIYGLLALSYAEMGENVISNAVLSIIFAVLALAFGYASHSRGYNNGKKKAGIVLGVGSLALSVIAIVIA